METQARKGPQAAGKARQQPLKPVAAASGATPGVAEPLAAHEAPPTLAEVQLIDAKAAARGGDVSVTWWHDKVASGIAPQPVFRAPRFTRWRAVEVAAFWRDYRPSTDRASEVVNQAAKASAKAQERRRAKAAHASEGP